MRKKSGATRVAVPLFEGQVAPRFCFAREILLATLEGGELVESRRMLVEELGWPERIRLLEQLGVSVILASGFNRCQVPMATAHGVTVLWGLCGDAEEVLRVYAAGAITSPGRERPPRGRHHGRHGPRGAGRGG